MHIRASYGRSPTDIGNAPKDFLPSLNMNTAQIYTECGESHVGGERLVTGREAQISRQLLPINDSAAQGIGPSKHSGGILRSSLGECRSDGGRADDLIADGNGRKNSQADAVLCAECLELCDRTLAAFSEGIIISAYDMANLQIL